MVSKFLLSRHHLHHRVIITSIIVVVSVFAVSILHMFRLCVYLCLSVSLPLSFACESVASLCVLLVCLCLLRVCLCMLLVCLLLACMSVSVAFVPVSVSVAFQRMWLCCCCRQANN